MADILHHQPLDGGARSDQTSCMVPILDGPSFEFRALRPNLRRAQRLAREGVPATARIAGIRILRGNDDSPDQHEWALEISRGAGDTSRA